MYLKVSIWAKTLMQKLNSRRILFIFIKSYYKKTKFSVIQQNDHRQGKIVLTDNKILPLFNFCKCMYVFFTHKYMKHKTQKQGY